MDDFDLRQALDGFPMPDVREQEHRSHEVPVDGDVKCNEGLYLEISKQPGKLWKMATMVLTVKKVMAAIGSSGSKITDVQPFNVLMENLENEKLIEKVQYLAVTKGKRRIFKRAGSVNECTLCDMWSKHIVLLPEVMELKALSVQGGYSHLKVKFSLTRYVSPAATRTTGVAVTMAITNTNFNISCSEMSGEPVLLLENCCSDKLSTIPDSGDMTRFLFYKHTTGISQTTFESVRYPGWFISTSQDEQQPLELCKAGTATRQTTFKI